MLIHLTIFSEHLQGKRIWVGRAGVGLGATFLGRVSHIWAVNRRMAKASVRGVDCLLASARFVKSGVSRQQTVLVYSVVMHIVAPILPAELKAKISSGSHQPKLNMRPLLPKLLNAKHMRGMQIFPASAINQRALNILQTKGGTQNALGILSVCTSLFEQRFSWPDLLLAASVIVNMLSSHRHLRHSLARHLGGLFVAQVLVRLAAINCLFLASGLYYRTNFQPSPVS